MPGIFGKKRKQDKLLDEMDAGWESSFNNTKLGELDAVDDPLSHDISYGDFSTSSDEDQLGFLRDEAFMSRLSDNEREDLLNNHKDKLVQAYKDQGYDKFKEVLGAQYVDSLPEEYKSQLQKRFSGYGNRVNDVERGASRAAGLIPAALTALNVGLGYKNINKIKDDIDVDFKSPIYRGAQKGVRPIQSIAPEIMAYMKQQGAFNPQKTSDAAANIISQQMGYNQQLDSLNKASTIIAEFRNKELDRHDEAIAENAVAAGAARDKTAKAAADNYNKRRAKEEEIEAKYNRRKGKYTADVLNKVHKNLENRSEYNQRRRYEIERGAKDNILEQIDILNDNIATTTDPTLKGEYEQQRNKLTQDLRTGNLNPYYTNANTPPTFGELLGSWAGTNHLKQKRTIMRLGGKLIPRRI